MLVVQRKVFERASTQFKAVPYSEQVVRPWGKGHVVLLGIQRQYCCVA